MSRFKQYLVFTFAERLGFIVVFTVIFLLMLTLWLLPNFYTPTTQTNAVTWQVLEKKVGEGKQKWNENVNGVKNDNEYENGNEVDYLTPNKNDKLTPNPYPQKPKPLVNIAVADSVAMLNVDGIGPVFAGRIVKYRNLLGGYYSINQLTEVYGIDAEKFAFIKKRITVGKGVVSQLNINTATFKSLMRHPYIGKEKTKALFDLKKKLGNFTTPNQLVEAGVFTPSEFEKVAPYLTAE